MAANAKSPRLQQSFDLSGLTKVALADESGTNRATVSRAVSGQCVRQANLVNIIDAFNRLIAAKPGKTSLVVPNDGGIEPC